MASEKVRSKYDKFGILSSFLCIIHCTIWPIAFALLANVHHPFSHALDFLFVAVSLVAVYFSSKNSSSLFIKSALWLSVCVFISGVVLEHYYIMGKNIALIGSAGLIIFHFFNIRHYKKC